MAGYEWYKTGTVIVRNGEKEVVGANTKWLTSDIKQGDIFIIAQQIYEIAEVIGETSLTLTAPYTGISDGAASYAIITRAGEVIQAELAVKIQEAIIKINEMATRPQIADELGLYIDADGDLAQGEGGSQPVVSLPIATATTLGGVKIGRNIGVTTDGTISTDIDEGVIQDGLEKVATTSEDMQEMLNEVFGS